MINVFEACEIAKSAALTAGQYVAAQRSRLIDGSKLVIDKKSHKTSLAAQVVTDVDRQSEKLIKQHLTPFIVEYDVGFLGEESGDDGSRFEKDYFWCVDPLDGTLAFVDGHKGVSVSIALVSREGVAVVGVIYDVDTSALYAGILGYGARCNEHVLTTKQGDQLTWLQDRSHREHVLFEKVKQTIHKEATNMGRGLSVCNNDAGAVMNVCWAMEQPSSVYFKLPKRQEGGGSLWDYAASTCIFLEAGGYVSDVDGHPLALNRRDSTFLNHRGVIFCADLAWINILSSLSRL